MKPNWCRINNCPSMWIAFKRSKATLGKCHKHHETSLFFGPCPWVFCAKNCVSYIFYRTWLNKGHDKTLSFQISLHRKIWVNPLSSCAISQFQCTAIYNSWAILIYLADFVLCISQSFSFDSLLIQLLGQCLDIHWCENLHSSNMFATSSPSKNAPSKRSASNSFPTAAPGERWPTWPSG